VTNGSTLTIGSPGRVLLTVLALGLLTVAAVVLGRPAPAAADTLFKANLDGAQEVPPVVTPATGYGTVHLNEAEDQALVSLSFSGLLGAQTQAHIHGPAGPGVDAPIVIFLPNGNFNNFVWNLTPIDVANLKAGLLYINVHSTVELGGEIRGQLLQGPVGGTVDIVQQTQAPAAQSASSSGSSDLLLPAIALAAASVTMATGGWYAWRRLSR
jgi:hypothetical protein